MATHPIRRGSGRSDEQRVHDLVGVGLGPANLALAVACEEAVEEGRAIERLFLESKASACWHPGMLLHGSLIQISVIKDLVTVHNPRSRFTFLNYLKEKGRLYQFLNLRDLYPTRVEFNDYLCWVAGQLEDNVRYGRRAVAVEPVTAPDGGVDELDVVVEDIASGGTERHRTRNVVVATGGTPWLPDGVTTTGGGRVLHSHEFLHRIGDRFPDRDAAYRFLVVGSGQSAAELFYHLFTNYPNADVTATVRRFGYKPVDESDFTNEVFFPQMVDFFYDLPEGKRREVVDSFRDVNYAVVDHALIRKIYRALYDEQVMGKQRARVRPFMKLERMVESESGVSATFENLIDGRKVPIEVDGAVVCTGYRWPKEHPLLDGLSDRFEIDDEGYRVCRDYSLVNREGFRAGVYLQGYCERTHGISETVLSLLPVRAQDVLGSVLERQAAASGGEAAAAEGELALPMVAVPAE